MLRDASRYRRFAASLYELLSLFAIWLFLTALLIWIFGVVDTPIKRLGMQFCLWGFTGAYFVLCWVTTGQTLATQAWKIKLVNERQQTLTVSQAFMRYVLASLSLLLLGAGFLWALIDRNRLFLHDRLLKTRLVHLSADN